MDNPLVSIVTSVFNNERFIRPFIESVLSQTYTNWELIIVNDGSTDRSGSICDEFCLKDKRINVIHQNTNSGISKARNTGIIHSHGEWLMITDADDILFPEGVSSLVACISKDINLVSAAYQRYINGFMQKEVKTSISEKLSIRDYTGKIGIIPQSRNLDRYVWNKLFKSSIIKDNSVFFYEDLRLFEDVCFIYQYLEFCHQSVYCTATPVYSYFRRTDGTAMSSRNHYTDRTLSWLLAYTRILSIVSRMDVSTVARARLKDEAFDIYHHIIYMIRNEKKGVKEEKKARALLDTCFPFHERCFYNCRHSIKRVVNKGTSLLHKFIRHFVK